MNKVVAALTRAGTTQATTHNDATNRGDSMIQVTVYGPRELRQFLPDDDDDGLNIIDENQHDGFVLFTYDWAEEIDEGNILHPLHNHKQISYLAIIRHDNSYEGGSAYAVAEIKIGEKINRWWLDENGRFMVRYTTRGPDPQAIAELTHYMQELKKLALAWQVNPGHLLSVVLDQ